MVRAVLASALRREPGQAASAAVSGRMKEPGRAPAAPERDRSSTAKRPDHTTAISGT